MNFVNISEFNQFSENTKSKIVKLNNALTAIKTNVDDKYQSLNREIKDLDRYDY